ncbi:MAG: PQQ-binding-like beta-propeller repeat protein, partial [Gemmataceae bacterium]
MEQFQKQFPKTKGKLAGREGILDEILRDLILSRDPRPSFNPDDWICFGGSSSRNLVSRASSRFLDDLSRMCRNGPAWIFDLEKRSLIETFPPGPTPGEEMESARRLAFYPILIGNHAVVSDSRFITAYDLKTGNVEVWYDAGKWVGGLRNGETMPATPDLRYSLTFSNNRLYARMGTQSIRDIRPDPRKMGSLGMKAGINSESLLVCLSARPGESGDRRRWMVRGTDESKNYFAVFEGAPLIHDGRVYIASTRFEGDRVVTAVHCYPAEVEDSVAPLLWKTDVCETRELLPATSESDLEKKQRYRHHLLTLAGSRIVYCSHSGAIVALDALTGHREWARRYPHKESIETEDEPLLNDLCPAIYADRKLFVAPSDSEHLYCLDPITGAVIWERTKLDPVHLAGVGNGKLIFTTWGNQGSARRSSGGLRAVQSDNGSDKGGWIIPGSGGGVLPFGRPILVDDLVLWPTYRLPYGVYAIRQKDGLQPDNPALLHRVVSGNLLWANQTLLVTTASNLFVYLSSEGNFRGERELSWKFDQEENNSLIFQQRQPPSISRLDLQESDIRSKFPSHSAHNKLVEFQQQKHLLCINSLDKNSADTSKNPFSSPCKCED